MKILAIDTATEACSVAFHNSELGHISDDHIFEICPQQHSQQILPMIDTLLTRNKLKMKDIDVLAYGRGPGSFTGLRIAASTVQGLALGANVPVVEVSTLAAMAQQNFDQHSCVETLSLIDARMQEVYMGYFVVKDGIAQAQQAECVTSPSNAKRFIETTGIALGQANFVGTGFEAYPDVFSNNQQQAPQEQENTAKVRYPNAKYMLALSVHAVHNNQTVVAEQIKPVYVRDTVTWKKLPNKE